MAKKSMTIEMTYSSKSSQKVDVQEFCKSSKTHAFQVTAAQWWFSGLSSAEFNDLGPNLSWGKKTFTKLDLDGKLKFINLKDGFIKKLFQEFMLCLAGYKPNYVGLIPGLAQWVKDLALPWAVV